MNFAFLPLKSAGVWLRQIVGEIWPSLIYTQTEMKIRQTLKPYLTDLIKETAYLHIQATKPDTVGELMRGRVGSWVGVRMSA